MDGKARLQGEGLIARPRPLDALEPRRAAPPGPSEERPSWRGCVAGCAKTGATISAEMAARIARGNRRIANTPAPSHKLTG